MQVICGGHGGGKTTRMIAAMRGEPNALLVVHSHNERQRLIGMYPDLRGRITTFDDFEMVPFSKQCPVYVDNADWFLRRMFGNVELFSIEGSVRDDG